jgi:hypothetical protein
MNKLCMKREPIVHKKARTPERSNLSTTAHTLSTAFARAPSKANGGNHVLFLVIPGKRSLY